MARSRRAAASVPRSRLGRLGHLATRGPSRSAPERREVWLTTAGPRSARPVGRRRLEVCALQVPLPTSLSEPAKVATDAARPSGSSAQKLHVDDRGDLRHPLIAVSPRLSCGERRPTTTASAGSPRSGRRSASTGSNAGCCPSIAPRTVVSTTVDAVTTGCGAVIRDAAFGGPDVGSAISGSTRLSSCRTSWSMSRGSASSSRSCLASRRWTGSGAGPRVVSRPEARRADRSLALDGARATVPYIARRRTGSRSTSAGSSWRTTPADPAAQLRPPDAGLGDAPPRHGACGGDASRGVGERRRDHRPYRRGPPRPGHRLVRTRHVAGVPGRARHLPLVLDDAGMTIEWRPDDRQFHLHNEPRQHDPPGLRGRLPRRSSSRCAARAGPVVRHLGPDRSRASESGRPSDPVRSTDIRHR